MSKKMPLKSIAAKIDDYLKKFERDDSHSYFNAGAWWHNGSYIMVRYISHHGPQKLTRFEAERYLEWLQNGNIGRHDELTTSRRG